MPSPQSSAAPRCSPWTLRSHVSDVKKEPHGLAPADLRPEAWVFSGMRRALEAVSAGDAPSPPARPLGGEPPSSPELHRACQTPQDDARSGTA